MTAELWPLLSPRPFAEYSPEEYLAYVRTLYRVPEKKVAAPPKEVSLRLNAKGTPVITVRRKPKWVTPEEIKALAAENNLTYQSLWMAVTEKKRKIEVRHPAKASKTK